MVSFLPIDAFQRAETMFDTAAKRIATKGPSADDEVQMMEAGTQYKADVKVVRAQDEMQKSTLDILA
jgi:hypothetical protein